MKPLCIDLFCGLGGWAEGFLAEGYTVIGFDIERHDYGTGGYPGQLVLQDVLTLHGAQFRDATCIVASPPCQEFSYMAMPWKRGKQIAAALRGQAEFLEDYAGSRTIDDLTRLFDACFRIQREACAAAGRYIPLVVENVKGAQPWVGRAKAHYGSYYLWGNVESVGGRIVCWGRPGVPEFGMAGVRASGRVQKVPGFNFHQHEKGSPGGSFQSAAVGLPIVFAVRDGKPRAASPVLRRRYGDNPVRGAAVGEGLKVPGIKLSEVGFNVAAAQRYREGVKQQGSGPEWFDLGIARHSSKSNSRKAASAMIAKIPPELARHVARMFKP